MSEYMWAKIEIGGTLRRSVLTNLLNNFDVAPPLSEEAGASLPAAATYLVREDDETRWGMFEELEHYLVEQAVPFDRASDGKYEHSPEIRRFRPAVAVGFGKGSQTGVDRIFLCDHKNRPRVASVDIATALAETQTREELAARLVALCGLDVPALPPLSMIEAAD